jgi:hypothetical protein
MPRPDFASELAAKLRSTAGVSEPAQVSRRSLLQSWWALAAGVALAAGGAWFVRDSSSRSRLVRLARIAAGDHQNCAITFNLAERPVSLLEAGQRYGEPYKALASFQLPPTDTLLEPLERHACVYDGHRFGHIVFRASGATASLLVTDASPPATPQLEPTEAGPAVASLPAGQFVAFLVADLDRHQVLRLAHALTDPLSKHLA